MSSYLVDKKTIDNIVNYVGRHRHLFGDDCFRGFSIDREDLESKEKCSELGRELWYLNFVATHQRYPDLEPDELPGPIPFPNVIQYELEEFGVSVFEAFDSITTLVYQCTEGTVPTMEAYETLETLACALCREALETCSDWREFKKRKLMGGI